MPAGRPTKYHDEYPGMIVGYFNEEEKKGRFPTLAGFAVYSDVDRDTLQEWTKKHKKFSVAYKKSKAIQERVLVNNALLNKYHGSFAIFTAKNVLGWRDTKDLDVTSKGEKIGFNLVTYSDEDKEKFE